MLLADGGVIDDNQDLLLDGLALLNNNNINIQDLFIDPFRKYLSENLKHNVISLNPITGLVDDSFESNGT
jgi:hypothetical protein